MLKACYEHEVLTLPIPYDKKLVSHNFFLCSSFTFFLIAYFCPFINDGIWFLVHWCNTPPHPRGLNALFTGFRHVCLYTVSVCVPQVMCDICLYREYVIVCWTVVLPVYAKVSFLLDRVQETMRGYVHFLDCTQSLGVPVCFSSSKLLCLC